MNKKLICIKNIEECGISIIADEVTNEISYIEHIYPVGSVVPVNEDIREMNEDVYELFKNY